MVQLCISANATIEYQYVAKKPSLILYYPQVPRTEESARNLGDMPTRIWLHIQQEYRAERTFDARLAAAPAKDKSAQGLEELS